MAIKYLDLGPAERTYDFTDSVFRAYGSYIAFYEHSPEKGRKTCWYTVSTKDGYRLGDIRWFSRWRKFSFNPRGDVTFEETCLRDIAEFIQMETRNYKAKAREKKRD